MDGNAGPPHDVGPPGLIDKLSKLSLVVVGNAKPTESMYTIFAEVSERFDVQRKRLNQLIEGEAEPLLSR